MLLQKFGAEFVEFLFGNRQLTAVSHSDCKPFNRGDIIRIDKKTSVYGD